jgi:hypothetical protein
MTRRRLAIAVLAIVALAGSLAARAADISGTWDLTVITQAGTGTPTLVLVQNGETLTGTYTGRLGTSPIKGTYKDGAIAFSFAVSGPMGSAEVTYTGKVDGDAMSGNMQMGSMAGGTFTGKRAP